MKPLISLLVLSLSLWCALPAQNPEVNLIRITDVHCCSVRVLASAAGEAIEERGVCYSLLPESSKPEQYVPFGTGHFGSFSCGVDELRPETTYYFRAYVRQQGQYHYSDEQSVSTLPMPVPGVSTLGVTEIKETSARVQGKVDGFQVLGSGVYWSEKKEDIRQGQFVSTGSKGFGSFSVKIRGLAPGTTYYVMFSAYNEAGTGFGQVVSFTAGGGR